MIIIFQYLYVLKRALLDRFTLLYTESDVPLLILYVRSCIINHNMLVTPKQVVIYLKRIHVTDIFFCHFSSPSKPGEKETVGKPFNNTKSIQSEKEEQKLPNSTMASFSTPQDASDMAKFHMRIELLIHEKSHSKRK